MSYIYFLYLTDVSRTSNSTLNKSSESRYPYLAHDVRGNAFSFSTLRMILAVGLLYMAYIMFSLYPLRFEVLL